MTTFITCYRYSDIISGLVVVSLIYANLVTLILFGYFTFASITVDFFYGNYLTAFFFYFDEPPPIYYSLYYLLIINNFSKNIYILYFKLYI